jgi:hypothetical protein
MCWQFVHDPGRLQIMNLLPTKQELFSKDKEHARWPFGLSSCNRRPCAHCRWGARLIRWQDHEQFGGERKLNWGVRIAYIIRKMKTYITIFYVLISTGPMVANKYAWIIYLIIIYIVCRYSLSWMMDQLSII